MSLKLAVCRQQIDSPKASNYFYLWFPLVVSSLFSTFADAMTDKERFAEKAASGYVVCYVEACPLREQCLRWLLGQQMPATQNYITCVNHRQDGVGTEHCPHHRPARKVLMAQGMTRISRRCSMPSFRSIPLSVCWDRATV